MSRSTVLGVMAMLFAVCGQAQAQSWEASGLIGLTPSVDLERRAPELDELAMSSGFTWGAQVAHYFSSHWGAEALWTWQSAALRIGNGSATSDLFDFSAMQLQGNAVYRFRAPDVRLQPFAFGGLGATFFSADDLESETKMSLGVGGGVTYRFWRSLGVRGQARYKPTLLNDKDSEDFCDPFGFCQGTLDQFELMTGVTVRF